jgi:hypothetical protein
VRRALLAIVGVLVIAAAAYYFLVRDTTVTPRVYVPELASTIGTGSEAVGVSEKGEIVRWLPVPDEPPLPHLSISAVPKAGRLAGPVREQALILGAAPAAFRPYIERAYRGENGIDVDLTSGIELRFGDASQAERKWKAAATILADPETTALDYVDLVAPNRPSTGGSGHALPELP